MNLTSLRHGGPPAAILAALLASCLVGCGGSAAGNPGAATAGNPAGVGTTAVSPTGPVMIAPNGLIIIAAGTSHIMQANEAVMVPAGAVISTPGHSVINVMGENNTINVGAGATVTVPASATGNASNKVVAGAVVSALSVGVELLAGGGAMAQSQSLDGSGAQARFQGIYQLALDGAGNLYAADRDSVRRISPAGAVVTLPSSPAARFGGLALDRDGQVYGAGALQDTLYRLTPQGALTPWATGWNGGKSGGGSQLAADAAGNLYLADFGGRRVLKFDASGVMSVLAGGGSGDGNDGVGVQAAFHGPAALAWDGHGALLVNDSDAVRRVLPDGTVKTLAAIPRRIIPSDGSIAVDAAGNAYVANDQDLRRVAPDGQVTVLKLADGSMPYILTMVADSHGYLYAATGWASPVQVWKIRLP